MATATTSAPRESDIAAHACALEISGYALLPGQLDSKTLEQLRLAADRALAAVGRAVKSGRKLAHTSYSAYYAAARCMYCWGDACAQMLEHPAVHAIASRMMGAGSYQLWDMTVLASLPAPPDAPGATTSWHRDFAGPLLGSATPGYLWFFFCLDDLTVDNGATVIIPGSHRAISKDEPSAESTFSSDPERDAPSSRTRLCANAGDLVVLNPTTLHSSSRNASNASRRLLNVAVCHTAFQPLLDHWSIAGPALRASAGPLTRKMLGADRRPLDKTWSVLPEGWKTE